MNPGQLLHQGQANARAFVGTGATVLDAVEPLEHARQVGLGDADAGIGDAKLDAVAERSQLHGNPPFERELERVRQQIQDDLFPHLPVHVHGLRQGIAVDDELEARLFDGRSKHARELRGERREVGRFEIGVDAARLDPGEIEQRVHEPQQSQGIAMRDLLAFSMHRRQRRPASARPSSSGPTSSVSGVRNS